MKIFREYEDGLRFGLSFFVVFGTILGSLFCNGMSAEMKKELCVTEQELVNRTALMGMDFFELFWGILPSRFFQLAVVLLISLTSFSAVFLIAAAGYLGFSLAVMISAITMSGGFFGIWRFLLLIFPQCLLYLPVIYLLFWWMPLGRKRLTIVYVGVLGGLVLMGVCLEAYVNPWVLLLF